MQERIVRDAKTRHFVDLGTAERVKRREFLRRALALGSLSSGSLMRQIDLHRTQRSSSSRNSTPTSNERTDVPVTANPDFFVRNHFAIPRISGEKWMLEVGGLVAEPLRLSYSDVLLMPSVRQLSTLECAGNASGGPGVGTVVWSGVPLQALLKQAGVKEGASMVVFHGADSGAGEDAPPGTHFVRAIPLEKAMEASTLVAYEMNNAPLPADHGFPMRAIVPGWYGMDWVKWLTRIEVLNQPFAGYFQQQQYVAVGSDGGRRPITHMLVSSKILRPSEGEEIHVKTYRVEGAAWAGERKIARVELRFNEDAWQQATLQGSPAEMVWTAWSYDWNASKAGPYTLEVRATDEDGHSQPATRDPNRRDLYELNTPHRVTVAVRI